MNLILACAIAFVAVFSLLAVLAALMRGITALFPVRDTDVDPSVAAAVATVVGLAMPGARVTRIEEES